MAGSLLQLKALRAGRWTAEKAFERLEERRLMSVSATGAAHAVDVALVDSALAEHDVLAHSVLRSTELISFDSRTDSARQVLGKVVAWAGASGLKINSISIVSHGSPGRFLLGKDWISLRNADDPAWKGLKSVLAPKGKVLLFGCGVAEDSAGQKLLNHLATITGADVYGSTNLTGKGGDWTLEAASSGAKVKTESASEVFNVTSLSQWDYSLNPPGITVTPTSGLVTTEAGGTATFTIVLDSHPTADVTIPLSSSNTNEGTVSPSSVTFTAGNWNKAQTVTVTGVDDFVDDGDVAYTIITGPASSGDLSYDQMDAADVAVTNQDNDTAGINVSRTSGLVTTEAGGTDSFTVVLTSQPLADVTIPIGSSNTNEGTVSTSLLTFTSANWDKAQTVTVTGVDDFVDDGNIGYTVITGAASSADGLYNGMAVPDVSVTNTDNDTAGVNLSAISGPTTEAGGTATFTMVLTSQPLADVTIGLSSSNTNEGTVSPASVTFTSGNWNVPQTVTVTGVNDAVDDGGVAYTIITSAASSGDGTYNGMSVGDVAVTNADDDPPVLNLPGGGQQTINEDNPLTLSTGNGNLISISGTSGILLQVTLTAGHGTMTLDGTSGLSFSAGDGTADGTMTFNGTQANIDLALDGLVYTPAANYYGVDSILVSVADQTNPTYDSAQSASGNVGVTITSVNDAPINAVPGAQTINEDNTLTFSIANGKQISISDVDAGSNAVRVTLGATNGVLTLSGTTGLSFISGDGTADAAMTFTGTISDINTALNGMTYTPNANYNGSASVQITTNDQGNSGAGGALSDTDSVAVTVNAVNDPPVNSVPGAQTINEDNTLTFSSGNGNAISISDVDAGTNAVRVTLTATNGTLALNGTVGLSFTVGTGSGDATMTFTGTMTDINAALDGMVYTPTANYNGAGTVSITTNDLGNTGSGGAQSDSDSVGITINAVNDAPVNTVPGAQTINEDNTLTFSSGNGNAISIGDVDAGGNSVRVTLTATHGTMTLSQIAGLSFTSGTGTGDATMTFTGTIANINAALNGLVYTPTLNYNGSASVQITTNDLGNSGAGGPLTDTDSVGITINAVNDPPVNSITAAQTTSEDTALTFSTANGNLISVSDVDAGIDAVQVTLTATHGTLTLAGTSGLTFSAGSGTGDTTMTFTGSLVDINAALDGMVYAPAADYNGAATVQIVTNDQGNTGSGGAQIASSTVNITVNAVNDPPVNTMPADQSTNVNVTLIFNAANGNAISIGDVDAGNNSVRVTLTVTGGVLTLSTTSGLTFTTGTGTGNPTMTFTGTMANINSALNGLAFIPTHNFIGIGSLQITTNDMGNTGSGGALTATNSIAVEMVTEFRVNTTISNTQYLAATAMDQIGDFVVVWASSNGQDGSGYGVFGQLYNNQGNRVGGEFQINQTTASDQTAPQVAMDYNGDFVVTWQSNNQDGNSWGIYARRYNLAGVAQGNEFQVNTTTNGAQDQPTIGMSADGRFVIAWRTVSGSTTDINAQLYDASGNKVGGEFRPNTTTVKNQNQPAAAMDANGNFIIVWASANQDTSGAGVFGRRYDSSGNPLTGEFQVNVTNSGNQNKPSVAAAPNGSFVVAWSSGNNQDGSGTGIYARRYDSGGSALGSELLVNTYTTNNQDWSSIGMDGGGNFTIAWSSVGEDGNGTGIYAQKYDNTGARVGSEFRASSTVSGSQDQPAVAMSYIGDLVIVWQGPGVGDSSGVFGQYTQSVNDAPVNSLPSNQTIAEDNPLTLSGGNAISVSDVDVCNGLEQITLTATNGTMALSGISGLSFSVGTGTGGDATMTFTGTLANINAALNGLIFSPNQDFNGAASIQIVSNDMGNYGSGGAQTDTDTVNITVTAVNDPPVNHLPAGQTTNEDTALVLSSASGNAISITDVDAASGAMKMTLSVSHGVLTLAQITGLTFITGTGSGDATMVFTGTMASVNAALNGLQYLPSQDYNGADSIQVTANDQGNSGAGGAQSVTNSLNITINAVNDAPVITVPATQTFNEDTTRTLSSGNGNQISVGDVDALGAAEKVTLTVSHGKLALSEVSGLTFITGTGSGDATMTFMGTLANINTALNGLAYTPTANYNGSDAIQITADDQGNTGLGGALTDNKTINLTINAVNDAPVNTVPGVQTTAEDTLLTFNSGSGNAISIFDVDADPGVVQVTLSVSHGALSLSGTAGLTFSTGDGSADAAMTFTGTQANINAALDGLIYAPSLNYNGAETLSITTNDLGNTGSGGALNDTDTVAVTVTAVNDAPVNTVPAAQTTSEDTALVLSNANGNAISISDVDVGAGAEKVTLSVSHGVLSVSRLTGLTFLAGDGTADALMTFTGTIANINAALDGLTYTPALNYNGADTLSITTDDQGNTGAGGALTDTDTVGITVNAVNDAPVLTVPGAQATNEDTALVFSSSGGNAISVSDVDAGSSPIKITLSVTHGVLTLSGTTGLTFITGDGTADASMVFTGDQSDIRAALDGLSYLPAANYNGSATLSISVNDQGNTGIGGALTDSRTVNLTINAVNDAPVNTIPAPQTTLEDTTLTFSAGSGNSISIFDVDADPGSLRVTLTASNGLLSLSRTTGLTFTAGDGTLDGTMTFTGTQANINAALDGLSFHPKLNYNGAASIQITTNDQGNTGQGGALSDSDTMNITVTAVNDAPVNHLPMSQTTAEDTPLVLSTGNGNAISVSDVDAGNGLLQITLSATHGTLTLQQLTGLTFSAGSGTADRTMTFTGTLTDINNALDGLTFFPDINYNGAASIQITTNDQGNTGIGGPLSDSDTLNLTITAVNDPPVNTVPATQTINEDNPLIFSSSNGNAISVTDVDADPGSVKVTLTTTHGVLTLSDTTGLLFLTGDGMSDTTMTFTGRLAEVNAALDGLTYVPDANYNGTDAVVITTDDQGNTGAGGPLSDTKSADITINAVNDPPVNTVPGPQVTDEDTPLVFTGPTQISVSDLDAGNAIVKVTLSVSHGTLSLSTANNLGFFNGTGTNDPTMTILGTIADINAALDGLTYQPSLNYNGSDTLTISTDDQGNTGIGGSLVTADTVDITVNAVNDPPVITVPGPQTTAEDTALIFNAPGANSILVSDVDAGNGLLRVTLSVAHGRLTLSSTTGLTFSTGDGTADKSMDFTGTLTDINAALDGLSYVPSLNYNGADTLHLGVNDQGNSGIGGPLTDSATVPLAITAVNDPPVNTVPGSQFFSEDTSLIFSAANGNQISISDVDATASGIMRVTLTVTHGVLTLSQTTGLSFVTGDGAGDATMIFTGTIANINAALNGMAVTPDANYDSSASLTISTNDQGNTGAGGPQTTTDTVNLNLIPVNDPPTLNASTGNVVYTENDLPTSVDPLLAVGDIDSPNLQSAVVRILNFHPGEDQLIFADQNGITGSWDGANGILTLSGSAAVANYQAALRSVGYFNSSDNPGTEARTIQFTVNDGQLDSNSVTRNVAVVAVDDSPVATLINPVSLPEDNGPASVSLDGVFSDPDNPTSSLVLSLTGNSNSDLFSSISVDTEHHTVDFESAPDANGSATITIRATDPMGKYIETTLNITVTPVNDAPVIKADGAASYPGPGAVIAVADDLVVSDVDNTTLQGAVVTMTGFVRGKDELLFLDQNGITGLWDSDNGRLTLSGEASVADYQTALRSIQYHNLDSSLDGLTRAVSFVVNDGELDSRASTRYIEIPLVLPQPKPVVPPPFVPLPDKKDSVLNDPVKVVVPPPPEKPIVAAAQSSAAAEDHFRPDVATPPAPAAPVTAAPVVQPAVPKVEVKPAPAPAPAPPPPVVAYVTAPAPAPPPPPVPSPIPPAPARVVQQALTKAESAAVWQKLDDLEQELDQVPKQAKIAFTPGNVTGMSTLVLSVGYVIWVLRGGSLVVTLLTTLPLWRWLDPLPVLDNYERKKVSGNAGRHDEDQDEENIRRMME